MNRDLILEYFVEYLTEVKSIKLISIELNENSEETNVKLKLSVDNEVKELPGKGVGIVDAGFNALSDGFGEQFKSLSTIQLSDLYFQVDHSAGRELSLKSKTKMKLEFRNDSKDKMCFSEKTTSMSFTSISVLVKAFEFYINCENLFKRLKFLIKDADQRGRSDVASKYRYNLSKVVEVTSYEVVA